MSATSPRGQTTRTRANVQKISIEPRDGGLLGWLGWHLAWATRWIGWLGFQAVCLAVYVPTLGGLALLVGLVLVLLGPVGWLVASMLVGVLLWGWRRRWPSSYERHIGDRVARWLRRLRYRATWDDICAASGVKAVDAARREAVPRLVRVRLGRDRDELFIQLCPGITVDEIAAQTSKFVSEFGALEVRVAPLSKDESPRVIGLPIQLRGWARMDVIVRDPFAAEQDTGGEPEVDLSRVPIGTRENGRELSIPLRGRHVLGAGSTGSGKGSIATAILWALAPAIRDGWVRVIGIDPKGGMEFGMYSELMHMFAWQAEEELVLALEAAAAMAEERCRRLQGRTRLHRPSVDDPHWVILIDEIASLTTYINDAKRKNRAKVAMGVLLSKGRAPGYTVVGMVQDPRKEVVELRNLFPLRIGLRLDSRTEVGMVLGDQAYDRGALCDHIPMTTPGVGYIVDEEAQRRPVKFRLDWHSDAAMRWLAAEYPSPTHEEVPSTVEGRDGGKAA